VHCTLPGAAPEGEIAVTQQAVPDLLGDRCGAPTRPARRRLLVTLVAVLGVLGLAVATWIGIGLAREPVQWTDVGYHVQGSDQVDVTFDVFMAPGARAQCTLHALNSQFAEVGVRTVMIEPATTRGQRLTESVATAERTVTGVVNTCARVDKGTG
jgi:hypothetical protein